MQERRNSIADAVELRTSSTKPSKYTNHEAVGSLAGTASEMLFWTNIPTNPSHVFGYPNST